MTPEAERRQLLAIARAALTAHVAGLPRPVPDATGTLARRAGAFVTLESLGALRGCIGHIEPTDPVALIVARCAIAAATSDPRFPPVRADELALLHIELSILGPLQPLAAIEEIEIGRHGLLVARGSNRGLLLPQVASERNWSVAAFVAQTCVKAGLEPEAWRRDATVWRFEAEVFGED